jgi:hypothetical protein
MTVARSPSANPSPHQIRPVLPPINRPKLPADGSPAHITNRGDGQLHDGVIVTIDFIGQLAEMQRDQANLHEEQGRDRANAQTRFDEMDRLHEEQGRDRTNAQTRFDEMDRLREEQVRDLANGQTRFDEMDRLHHEQQGRDLANFNLI